MKGTVNYCAVKIFHLILDLNKRPICKIWVLNFQYMFAVQSGGARQFMLQWTGGMRTEFEPMYEKTELIYCCLFTINNSHAYSAFT